jgi:hypothetical protein
MDWIERALRLERFAELDLRFNNVDRAIDLLRRDCAQVIRALEKRPDPFVAIVVFADDGKGPTSMAESGHVPAGGHRSFSLSTFCELSNIRINVFCDVERVQVRMYAGSDMVACTLRGSPLGYVEKLPPGVPITVECIAQ